MKYDKRPTEQAFFSTAIITTVTKRQLAAHLRKVGYFNISYSGYNKGFHATFFKGAKPIY